MTDESESPLLELNDGGGLVVLENDSSSLDVDSSSLDVDSSSLDVDSSSVDDMQTDDSGTWIISVTVAVSDPVWNLVLVVHVSNAVVSVIVVVTGLT